MTAIEELTQLIEYYDYPKSVIDLPESEPAACTKLVRARSQLHGVLSAAKKRSQGWTNRS